jgi:outer membrane protein assembly factor BamB
MNEPLARHSHPIEELTVWRYKIRGADLAVLPNHTTRPNPLVVGDVVLASIFSPGFVCAFDRMTGRQHWRVQTDGLAGSTVTFADGILYAQTGHTLYALDPTSGAIFWTFCPYGTEHEWIYSAPTIHKELVFIGDRTGKLHCLDARSGKPVWWKQTSRSGNPDVNTTALVHKHSVIVASNAGLAVAYEAASGRQLWRTRLDGPCGWELCIFEKKVVVTTRRSIYLLDPENGEVVQRSNWRRSVIKAFAATKGSLIAIKETESSWLSANTDDVNDTASIAGVRRGNLVFERPTSKYAWGLRWDKKTGLLYESRIDGFGILSASTGERIHDIRTNKSVLEPGLVDVQDNIIYLLSTDGSLYALNHP